MIPAEVFRDGSIDAPSGGRSIQRHHFASLTSTLDHARALAAAGAPAWTVVTADVQTAGRGTRGRSWIAPQGTALLVSVVCPPQGAASDAAALTLAAAAVLGDVLRECCGLETAIKHPNDLLAGGRKIAGILFESATNGDRLDALLLGMGVNLAQTQEEFDAAGLAEATSVMIETGTTPDRETLLAVFLDRFIRGYAGFTAVPRGEI